METDNLLSIYLRDISACEPLDRATEAALMPKIRQGDRKALDTLVKANIKFVIAVCKNYTGKGVLYNDLICEGSIGLIRAAKRFDETKNLKFISYAVWWVRQAILTAIAKMATNIKQPSNNPTLLAYINKQRTRLYQQLKRRPTGEELSHALNLKEKVVQKAININDRETSLDGARHYNSPFKGSLLANFKDKACESPDKNIRRESIRKEVAAVMGALTDTEKKVLRIYFGFDGIVPQPLRKVGEQLGISYERARQIKEEALKRLQHPARLERLKTCNIK